LSMMFAYARWFGICDFITGFLGKHSAKLTCGRLIVKALPLERVLKLEGERQIRKKMTANKGFCIVEPESRGYRETVAEGTQQKDRSSG